MIDAAAPSRRSLVKTLAIGLSASTIGSKTHAEPKANIPATGDLFVTDFGAHGDGVADDTAAFEHAITAAERSGQRLRIPAGRYRIARTLEINRGITIEGDGVEFSIILGSVGNDKPIFHVYAKETDSIIGFRLSSLKLICQSGDEICDGIRLSTGGGGAAIHQSAINNIFISNVGIGVAISGVVYRCCFENITVSGAVENYGFYSDKDFIDVTYNSFWNLEVTNVKSGAYAYWIHSNFSNMLNITADGCGYFSMPGGSIRNISVEGISASKPASDTVLQLNQVQTVEGINLLGIDPKKCAYGIEIIGQATIIRGVRCMAEQPHRLFKLGQNSEGVIAGVQTEKESQMIESYVPKSTLDGWVLQGARSITRQKNISQ